MNKGRKCSLVMFDQLMRKIKLKRYNIKRKGYRSILMFGSCMYTTSDCFCLTQKCWVTPNTVKLKVGFSFCFGFEIEVSFQPIFHFLLFYFFFQLTQGKVQGFFLFSFTCVFLYKFLSYQFFLPKILFTDKLEQKCECLKCVASWSCFS